jgi:hypothetical protein
MRLDLAVDVKHISVGWFQSRLKANHKQFIANFGSAEFIEMGRGGIQTLYFGKRPNLYRIYDKVAEYKYRYAKLLRSKEDGDVPTFEEFCGLKETDVITRVERQIGGKIPEQFSTVGQLRTLDTYDPFDNLKIIVGGTSEPNPDDYGFIEYCAGMFLRQKAEREGMHAMIKFIAKHSNRNTGKIRDKFTPFFPEMHDNEMVNTYYLNERFRRSVARQLAV